jgi:hypothetical protein
LKGAINKWWTDKNFLFAANTVPIRILKKNDPERINEKELWPLYRKRA